MINYLDALKKSAENKSTKSNKEVAKEKTLYNLGKSKSIKEAYLEDARLKRRNNALKILGPYSLKEYNENPLKVLQNLESKRKISELTKKQSSFVPTNTETLKDEIAKIRRENKARFNDEDLKTAQRELQKIVNNFDAATQAALMINVNIDDLTEVKQAIARAKAEMNNNPNAVVRNLPQNRLEALNTQFLHDVDLLPDNEKLSVLSAYDPNDPSKIRALQGVVTALLARAAPAPPAFAYYPAATAATPLATPTVSRIASPTFGFPPAPTSATSASAPTPAPAPATGKSSVSSILSSPSLVTKPSASPLKKGAFSTLTLGLVKMDPKKAISQITDPTNAIALYIKDIDDFVSWINTNNYKLDSKKSNTNNLSFTKDGNDYTDDDVVNTYALAFIRHFDSSLWGSVLKNIPPACFTEANAKFDQETKKAAAANVFTTNIQPMIDQYNSSATFDEKYKVLDKLLQYNKRSVHDFSINSSGTSKSGNDKKFYDDYVDISRREIVPLLNDFATNYLNMFKTYVPTDKDDFDKKLYMFQTIYQDGFNNYTNKTYNDDLRKKVNHLVDSKKHVLISASKAPLTPQQAKDIQDLKDKHAAGTISDVDMNKGIYDIMFVNPSPASPPAIAPVPISTHMPIPLTIDPSMKYYDLIGYLWNHDRNNIHKLVLKYSNADPVSGKVPIGEFARITTEFADTSNTDGYTYKLSSVKDALLWYHNGGKSNEKEVIDNFESKVSAP